MLEVPETLRWKGAVFNIEVFNTCQMSFWLSFFEEDAYSLFRKCHPLRWPKCHLLGFRYFFFFLTFYLFMLNFTKMCYAKFPPIIVKASPKIVCHKIQWLHFANKHIVGLQSWHSSRHFQTPITPAILTPQLQHDTDCNSGLASTTICERGFSKQDWVKSDVISPLKHWMHWYECHYEVFQ